MTEKSSWPENPVRQPCCDTWAKAHEAGTDNEMYGSLVGYDKTLAFIGDAFRVNFCPFCGSPKTETA